MGPNTLFGFLCRFGGIPTNVGSGGGVQPLAVLRSNISMKESVKRINDYILSINFSDLLQVIEKQKKMAMDYKFTYLLGPIDIALRPRLITALQVSALERYSSALWEDCLTLEQMWIEGELDDFINIDERELEIARMQPWKGSSAIFASDGLFNFGVHTENK